MDPKLKKTLRGISLEIRRLLEGRYDEYGHWQGGDLERRLNELGLWRDRNAKPVEELPHLSTEDKTARRLVDGYLKLREEAGVGREEAVSEFVRESAYTWANRLFALRCMEARGIIDEVILQKDAYGGRSLAHFRFAKKNPDACARNDDGLFAVLFAEFEQRAQELPAVFDPKSPAVGLRPSIAALKRTIALLSGREAARGQEPATDEVFAAPDAFGWAYQYWNAEEQKRVFEMVRTVKGAKIQGADIVPATQFYTEPYMVKFLVQNSLGALWMGMYPSSTLSEQWDYYVKTADRVPVMRKPVREITFLDPAQGSGHFHLEAFDLFYAIYAEEAALEGRTPKPREICATILNQNLYGIDIDGRSVQIATAALWMKAKERAPELEARDLTSFHEHLVATNIRLPKGKDHLELFLQKHPEDEQLRLALELVFRGLEHADELGALLQIEEPVDTVLRRLKEEADKSKGAAVQAGLFEPTLVQGTLPVGVEDYGSWKRDALNRLQAHFEAEARSADSVQAFFGESAGKGLAFFNLLSRRYDVVAANPPYMGSKNMSAAVRSYVDSHYNDGKTDLFAGMLLRCQALLIEGGRLGVVVPETWMFLSSFVSLRSDEQVGILTTTALEVLAQMGRHAFSEADPPSNVSLFVLCKRPSNLEHKVTAFQITKSRPAEEQAALLLDGVTGRSPEISYHRKQIDFFDIPLNPICYWLTDNILNPFRKGKQISAIAECKVTCKTSNNSKFVRFWWECPLNASRWKPYEKESVGLRFLSSPLFVLDWSDGAQHFYHHHFSAQLPHPDYLFTESIVSSKIKRPNVTARVLHGSALADMSVNQIFPHSPLKTTEPLCALLNSRVSVYYLRLLNPTVNCNPTDLERIPLAQLLEDDAIMAELSKNWKKSATLIERLYRCSQVRKEFANSPRSPDALKARVNERIEFVNGTWREYSTCTEAIDLLVGRSLGLDVKDWSAIEFDIEVSSDDGDDNDTSTKEVDSAGFAVGDEFFRSPDAVAQDFIQEIILLCLGHRWPKQLESRESLSAWTDQNGVIPVTSGREVPLVQRVRERLAEQFPGNNVAALEREFEEIVGVQLEEWVAGPMFEWHISQFKKRPIAWQIGTDARGQRIEGKKKKSGEVAKPVFACLINYHKVDEDLLPKVRTQYIGVLRSGYETELRTLERLANPTAEQQGRKLQLDQWIEEMKAFDVKLGRVSLTGFGPVALHPALRQYAINDALLSLTACWLRKLNEAIFANALEDWQNAAADMELHADFQEWIGDAFTRLDYFCAAVGPKAPAQKSLVDDPTSEDLAPLVCVSPATRVRNVLNLACERWWQKFDETVLAPLKEQLRQAREELERVKEELELDEVKRNYARQKELADRKDELKIQIKSLRDDIDEKTDKGKELRSHIEAWSYPEAAAWEDWLCKQPLFDVVASLDGTRQPPTTITEFIAQESVYAPDINDGVRVNIAPVQKAGLLHAEVLDSKDADKAIANRAEWRADERRWVREGKLPQPGWWKTTEITT